VQTRPLPPTPAISRCAAPPRQRSNRCRRNRALTRWRDGSAGCVSVNVRPHASQIEPALAPQQPRHTAGDGEIARTAPPAGPSTSTTRVRTNGNVLHRASARPPTRAARPAPRRRSHDQTIDADQTANFILHPLLLLLRDFDNAKPARRSACLYPGSTPPDQQDAIFNRRRGQFSTGASSRTDPSARSSSPRRFGLPP
jgi:hypothetical protein